MIYNYLVLNTTRTIYVQLEGRRALLGDAYHIAYHIAEGKTEKGRGGRDKEREQLQLLLLIKKSNISSEP